MKSIADNICYISKLGFYPRSDMHIIMDHLPDIIQKVWIRDRPSKRVFGAAQIQTRVRL